MLRLAPSRLPRAGRRPPGRSFPPKGTRKGRVALLAGCVTPVIGPSINEAAIRVLTRHGIEVVLPEGQGCCGGVVHHMGREHEALAAARRNVDAWIAEIDGEGLDAILITASGCGTTVKDYGFMLRTDPAYAAKAKRISALAKDICEYLARLDLRADGGMRGLVAAYHAACSLQHGQKITREPKELLSRAGFVVKDVPEGHLCCGSAGTYNILQPDIAERLRERKIANIEKVKPDVIAAGNIGCITQIAAGTAIPVVHPVELIDWATGGPQPAALKGNGDYRRCGADCRGGTLTGTERARALQLDVVCVSWCRQAGLYRNLSRNDREDDHGEEAEEVEDEGEEDEARRPGAQEEESSEKRRSGRAAAEGRPPKKKAKKRSAPRKAKPAAAAAPAPAVRLRHLRRPADARHGSAVAGHRHRRLGRGRRTLGRQDRSPRLRRAVFVWLSRTAIAARR